jgi:hypothetical protein
LATDHRFRQSAHFLAVDVDNDNQSDLILLQQNSGPDRIDLFWHEATDQAGTNWTQVVKFGEVPISDHSEGFQGSRLAQIVTGGPPEIVISTFQGPCYFTIPVNPQTGGWPRVWIAPNDSDEGIGVEHMDADGHADVVFTSGNSKQVKWAKNPGNGSSNWAVYVVGVFPEADWLDRCEAMDVNGDQRTDIVVTEENAGNAPDALCYWWEQPPNGATQTNWTRHLVTTRYTLNSMDSGDVDKDGDIDLVLAEHRGTKEISVFASDGTGSFVEFPVGTGEENHLGAKLIDLDGDGDLDLAGIAYDDFTRLHVWRNDSPGGTPTVARPVISPNGGVFDEPLLATISCNTVDAEIWYSLDNSTPTNGSPSLHFTNTPFAISTTTTVKARGFKVDYAPSLIASASFTGPQARTPVITPPGGIFSESLVATIACATTGVVIQYTVNGTIPDENASVYTAGITITNTTFIRTRAFSGRAHSE